MFIAFFLNNTLKIYLPIRKTVLAVHSDSVYAGVTVFCSKSPVKIDLFTTEKWVAISLFSLKGYLNTNQT